MPQLQSGIRDGRAVVELNDRYAVGVQR